MDYDMVKEPGVESIISILVQSLSRESINCSSASEDPDMASVFKRESVVKQIFVIDSFGSFLLSFEDSHFFEVDVSEAKSKITRQKNK